MKYYAVYNPAGGPGRKKILRRGMCQDADLVRQARQGEAVVEAQADHTEQDIYVPADGAPPYPLQRLAADVEAQRARFTPADRQDPLAVIVELLKAKGFAVTEADLAKASTDLQAKDSIKKGG